MNVLILLLITASQEPQVLARHKLATDAFSRVKFSAPRNPSEIVIKAEGSSGNCSIPLLEVLKDKTVQSKMPVLKPEGQFTMPIITPKVCENWTK